MTEPIYTTYQIGNKKWASIDYFHDSTDHKYTDQNKYKITVIINAIIFFVSPGPQ